MPMGCQTVLVSRNAVSRSVPWSALQSGSASGARRTRLRFSAAATIGPWLAAHMDVNAIDLTGIAGDAELATALEQAAAENLKRVRRAPAAEPDWNADPGTGPMTAFLETKTVWHPIGV